MHAGDRSPTEDGDTEFSTMDKCITSSLLGPALLCSSGWLVGCLLRLLRAYMFGFAHSFMQCGLATEHSLSIPSPIMNPSPCPTAIKLQRSLWFLEAHITFRRFFCSCFSSQKLFPATQMVYQSISGDLTECQLMCHTSEIITIMTEAGSYWAFICVQ